MYFLTWKSSHNSFTLKLQYQYYNDACIQSVHHPTSILEKNAIETDNYKYSAECSPEAFLPLSYHISSAALLEDIDAIAYVYGLKCGKNMARICM